MKSDCIECAKLGGDMLIAGAKFGATFEGGLSLEAV
jgi:hypothetical protein